MAAGCGAGVLGSVATLGGSAAAAAAKLKAKRSTGMRMALSITLRLPSETGFPSSFAKWLKGLEEFLSYFHVQRKTAVISKTYGRCAWVSCIRLSLTFR